MITASTFTSTNNIRRASALHARRYPQQYKHSTLIQYWFHVVPAWQTLY